MLLERDQEFIFAPARAAYRPATALKPTSKRERRIEMVTVELLTGVLLHSYGVERGITSAGEGGSLCYLCLG